VLRLKRFVSRWKSVTTKALPEPRRELRLELPSELVPGEVLL
jgi:hypothetical protein